MNIPCLHACSELMTENVEELLEKSNITGKIVMMRANGQWKGNNS